MLFVEVVSVELLLLLVLLLLSLVLLLWLLLLWLLLLLLALLMALVLLVVYEEMGGRLDKELGPAVCGRDRVAMCCDICRDDGEFSMSEK